MSEPDNRANLADPAGGRDGLAPLEWLVLAGAGVVLVLFRLHAFDLPLETDECNYAYIGARLLAGDRLYTDIWDHQPFGIFALFAGVIAVFGDDPSVFRWLATAFSLGSLGLVFAVSRRCAGRPAAALAAILFALASSDPGTAGEGCNREIYMNTCILGAWYLAVRSAGLSYRLIFAAGVALAMGSGIKTIVAVHWIALAPWIMLRVWRQAGPAWRCRAAMVSLGWFAVGPAAFWLASLAYFAATDRAHEFVDAVFMFNLSYSEGAESFAARFARFFAPKRHPFIFDSAWPIWSSAAIASAVLLFKGIRSRCSGIGAVLALVAGSFVAVCLPAQFWPHYYYLLIPPLVIVAGSAVTAISEWCGDSKKSLPFATRLSRIGLYAVLPVWLTFTEYREYLSQPPFGITVKRYNSRDFWGRAYGEKVRQVTNPEDSIFVFGNDTGVYYYAQRRCASRYSMITGLRTGYKGAEQRRKILLQELEKDPPRLIVVLFDEPAFAQWQAFLNEHYGEPIGWDFHDRTGAPIMFVMARKDQPVQALNWDWDRTEVGGWNVGAER